MIYLYWFRDIEKINLGSNKKRRQKHDKGAKLHILEEGKVPSTAASDLITVIWFLCDRTIFNPGSFLTKVVLSLVGFCLFLMVVGHLRRFI